MVPFLKIAILFDYHFSVRDFLFTPVWDEMKKHENVHFYLISSSPEVKAEITSRNCSNIFYSHPTQFFDPRPKSMLDKLYGRILKQWQKIIGFFDDCYLFDTLAYRFVAIHGLSHYEIRRRKSRQEQERHRIFLNYRQGEKAGRPFPKSKILFRLLYDFRSDFFNVINKRDLGFFHALSPDLFVFGRLHWMTTAYWARILRRLNIPMIGIVASWDHPTVQGPTPKGMNGYVVASRHMFDEMSDLHSIQLEKIRQIGKVQMDIFKNKSIIMSRENFLKQINIPLDHCLVAFGTNSYVLKDHEVSIARKLADDFCAGRYGKSTLLLRTHPQDLDWNADFLPLAKHPHVVCVDGASFGYRSSDNFSRGNEDQIFLANLMKHSDLVIQSRGSLALDAIAFDTPVISLAFDGDLHREAGDSFLWENCYEHYKPLIAAGGTWVAGSYKSLERAIQTYLGDPSVHSVGREVIRRQHIEPLDGGASKRLVDYLVEMAEKSRNGQIPNGDWEYKGIGDVSWAARQECDIMKYLDE
jgi:hypothetical protein